MNSEEFNKPVGQAIEATDFLAPGDNSALGNQADNNTGSSRGVIEIHSGAAWWHSQFNLMLLVFALLGAATLLFIAITPTPEIGTANTHINAAGEVSSGASVTARASQETQVAPFDESQREQARADSQDILASLLDTKKLLEQKGAQEWAKQRFANAVKLAEDGDAQYQQKNYADAINQYASSLESFEAIYELIPIELKRRVSLGVAAIAEGKSILALEQFQSALNLDRNHIPALQGLQRVETLDEVLQLIAAASMDEQDFISSDDLNDIAQAKDKYQQALQLDANAKNASLGLERVTGLAIDKQYRVAMSDGYNALFASRYTAARSAFSVALGVKPNDKTAKDALRQSLASDTRTSLGSLLSNAKSFEANEQWANALSNYQAVLQRDSNQVSAKIGRIRSQARLDLDTQLTSVLKDTLELSRLTARERAQSVLADAKAISVKGPGLSSQIAALETSLRQADRTVKVSFSSDSLTQVSLKKVGAKRINLGKFEIKKLALKPGRYTLIGTRLGFHDKRTELELVPTGSAINSFTIACNEPISDAG